MSNDNDNKDSLRRGIVRLMASDSNARHLRSMPIFRVEHDMPADLEVLLHQIDGSERSSKARHN